jgi:hypothetical protein
MPNKMYFVPAEDVKLLRKAAKDMHKLLHDSRRPDRLYSFERI